MKIQELAPAKINLALDILGRRPDGYHELRMVMQTVSLCDTVTVEEGGSGFTLLADGFTLPAGKISLEQQAAEAFFAAVGQPMPPLTVRLEKVTPAYAGLGGRQRGCGGAAAVPAAAVRAGDARGAAAGHRTDSGQRYALLRFRRHGSGRGPGRTADGAAGLAGLLDRTVQAGFRHPHARAVCPGGRRTRDTARISTAWRRR